MTVSKPHLILYSRDYCHLCHDMLAALQVLRGEQGGSFEIDVVDIDADPVLLARFDELVPVLGVSEGTNIREICHYSLDVEEVRGYLAEAGASSA